MNDDNILNGAKTAFIDKKFSALGDFKPRLVVNSYNEKVLNSIKEELANCDEFFISVAFITMGGLTPLLQDLKELENKNIKGKILTTDYLNFTEPKALKKLNEFSNIEIKLYTKDEFHTKGYLFKKGDIYKAIVGSSNLTMNALTVNKEWNIGFSSLGDGEMIDSIFNEFNSLWEKANNLDDVIDNYEYLYSQNKRFTNINKIYDEIVENNKELVPNSMQESFLTNIRNLIQKGENKALLISATGTGKTFASAFAVYDFKPKKFLFLVHREQIAIQSIESYKKIFKNESYKFGLVSGNSKEFNKDYVFSTIQTMSKEDVYTKYSENEFDYIVIDEVHKAGANSYLKILNYFKPKFWLGMSASPDRTDDVNIYELFDFNIALNIRLQNALEDDLLCPFHYFGIQDIEDEFNDIITNKKVSYLIEKSEYYGYSGNRVKALVFCSRKIEAKQLADEFTKRGHPSVALSGEDSQNSREDAIDRLTNDERVDKLEYIFTVDIFNEGVDIPEINQIMLVRPTESSIIFIQQLGRGLRKFNNKEYVVIIDFIGNYKKNFLIPIALSGDCSYDKDSIRKYLMEGNKVIPGPSSINFDEISKKRIYEAINNASFSRIALFKEKYQNLKFKLGRIPYLVDFYKNHELDPLLILNHNAFDCYHNFLLKVEDDYNGELLEDEIKSLKFISDVIANGKRPHEIYILKLLIHNKYFSIDMLKKYLDNVDEESIESALNIFNLNFFTKNDKKKYEGINFFNDFKISESFNRFLNNPIYYKHINDILDFALMKNKEYDNENLTLYKKYSRKDVCRLLNWSHDDSATMYGYRIKHNTCPIFVTYNKNEDISNSTKYRDEFISKNIFSWMTRSRVSIKSKEAQSIINYKENNLKIHLFVKKSDDEGREFYYLGEVIPFKWEETTIKDDNENDLTIVNFKYKLRNSIKDDLYNYFKD